MGTGATGHHWISKCGTDWASPHGRNVYGFAQRAERSVVDVTRARPQPYYLGARALQHIAATSMPHVEPNMLSHCFWPCCALVSVWLPRHVVASAGEWCCIAATSLWRCRRAGTIRPRHFRPLAERGAGQQGTIRELILEVPHRFFTIFSSTHLWPSCLPPQVWLL